MCKMKLFIKPRVTYKDIAEAYGCTISFVGHVAEERRKPPERFKLVVSELLGLPIELVFPIKSGDQDG